MKDKICKLIALVFFLTGFVGVMIGLYLRYTDNLNELATKLL